MAERMKGGNKSAGTGRKPPKWEILEESAQEIAFDLKAMAGADRMGFKASGYGVPRLYEEYAKAVSVKIAEAIREYAPDGDIRSTQMSATDIDINTLTAGNVRVEIMFCPGISERHPAPELSAKVIGEKELKDAVAEKVRAIMKGLV